MVSLLAQGEASRGSKKRNALQMWRIVVVLMADQVSMGEQVQ
jgi:hypothetical protein